MIVGRCCARVERKTDFNISLLTLRSSRTFSCPVVETVLFRCLFWTGLPPSYLSGFFGNLSTALGRKFGSTRCPAFQATLAGVFQSWVVLNLPRRDPHDIDRVADHVGGALLAFRASGHGFNIAVENWLVEGNMVDRYAKIVLT